MEGIKSILRKKYTEDEINRRMVKDERNVHEVRGNEIYIQGI